MENGTVRLFIGDRWLEGKGLRYETHLSKLSSITGLDDEFEYRIVLEDFPKPMDPQPSDSNHPEPFNDGECLHYTRFHPQLKDMIGTEGCFYDCSPKHMMNGILDMTDNDGYPVCDDAVYAYFAVPIEKPKKIPITYQEALRNSILDVVEALNCKLQEIADKSGVDVGQLRIKE